jgi:acylphosphatase
VAAESRALKFLVSGKVRGVYFRGSAAAEAGRLGIAGWAKNLSDGRVEVVAFGEPQALADFTDWLWKGPPSAIVEGVRAELWTGGDIAPGFGVR